MESQYKKVNNIFENPSRIARKNLSYSQARARGIKLNPFGDADKDGVKNWIDCRPFNKKKQDDGLNGQRRREAEFVSQQAQQKGY